MESKKERKGLFERFAGSSKKEKKSSCCCDFEIEEIPPDTEDDRVLVDSGNQIFNLGGNKMKTLTIEWKHLDVAGETCNRCYDTGENLNQEVKRLNRTLQPQGIEVNWLETKLDDTQIPQSNTILFNGVPIEDILEIEVSENFCESCTALLGSETYCRTIKYEGEEYEDIPAKAIRQAAYTVLGISEKAPEESTGCGCNCNGCC